MFQDDISKYSILPSFPYLESARFGTGEGNLLAGTVFTFCYRATITRQLMTERMDSGIRKTLKYDLSIIEYIWPSS